MFIDRDDYERMKYNLEEGGKEYRRYVEFKQKMYNKMAEVADLLGYQKKKKEVERCDLGTAYGVLTGGGVRDETHDEYLDRLLAEDKEKKRLIALAADVERGMVLRGRTRVRNRNESPRR